MKNVKFVSVGVILRARSITEVYQQKGIGYIPSSYAVLCNGVIFISIHASVYDTPDIGINSQCIKIDCTGEEVLFDFSTISHAFIKGDIGDESLYYGPIVVEEETWSPHAAAARKDFDVICEYLVDLIQQKMLVQHGQKSAIDKAVDYILPRWINSHKKFLSTFGIVSVVSGYFDMIKRRNTVEIDEVGVPMIDVFYEFPKETQQMIDNAYSHIISNLSKEFPGLGKEEKKELLGILEEAESYEFLDLIPSY